MIYALIALIGEGVGIALLAIIATVAIGRNSSLERERGAALQDAEGAVLELEAALAGKEALKAENGRLQQELHYVIKERDELAARSTALQEALEAKPTGPSKRVVRKNTSTPQTTEEEARQAEQAARYNRELDERSRISAENRDKPWLPLHDGE